MKKGTGLKSGLTRKNPPGVDSSMGAQGKHPSVDKGAVRQGTAASPKTLGPRTA